MDSSTTVPVPLALGVVFSLAIACRTEPDVPRPVPATEPDTDTDVDSDTDPPESLGLRAYPSFPLVYVGESVQLRAREVTSAGEQAVGNDATWSTSGPGSVTPTGLFTASTAAETDVRVQFAGNERAFAIQVRDPADAVASAHIIPSTATTSVGHALLFSAQVQTTSGARGDRSDACTWTSSDDSVAVASFAGLVLPQGEGTAQISADCDGHSATSTVTVGTPSEAALSIATPSYTLLEADTYRLNFSVENASGSGTAVLDVNQPESGAIRRFSLPTLGAGDALPVSVRQVYTGPRPIVLPVEIRLDDGPTQTVPVELPGDAEADVTVEFGGITVFGPTDAGVIFTVTNQGPETLENVTAYFERDQPGATSLSDFQTADAERSVTIATLPPNEPFTWVFDYDQVPVQQTWESCGFVPVGTWSEPTPDDNFACGTFPEY